MTARRGYIYFSKKDPYFAKATVGSVFRIEGRGPPWLVVSDLERVLFPGWRGEFFLAEVVDAISDEEQEPYGGAPASWAGYTRAAAVQIIEQFHLPRLFGRHGDEVAAIIDAVSTLTEADAEEMIARRHDKAHAVSQRAEKLIRGDLDRNGSGYDTPFNNGSPLGALFFLDQVVGERAVAVAGKRAFDEDPDDPEGALMAEPWSSAVTVLWHATLAIGAPDVVTGHERGVLLQGSERFRSRI